MPEPRKGEHKDDYISRCAGSAKMNDEFPDQKQRLAVCYSYWDKHKNESQSFTFKDFLMELATSDKTED